MRGFAGNPQNVANYVYHSVKCSSQILTTLKHYPGHGRTHIDSHQVIPVINISRSEWEKTDYLPFKAGIDAGTDFVMMGHLVYPQIDTEPASLSLTHNKILREKGFEGLIITDDLRMLVDAGLNPEEVIKNAFIAGNDILLCIDYPIDLENILNILEKTIHNGFVTENEVNERVGRILRKKRFVVLQNY